MSNTKKKIYTKSKAFDKSCRSNGSCPYCKGNRLHKNNKRLAASEFDLAQYTNIKQVMEKKRTMDEYRQTKTYTTPYDVPEQECEEPSQNILNERFCRLLNELTDEVNSQSDTSDVIIKTIEQLTDALATTSKSRDMLLKLLQLNSKRLDSVENYVDILMTEREEGVPESTPDPLIKIQVEVSREELMQLIVVPVIE